MSETTTIPSRIAHCAGPDDEDEDGDETYTITGDAIGAGDVTRGLEDTRKVWLAEELESRAQTLEGRTITPLHSEQEVGEVTRAGWDPTTETVVYEAEVTDAKLAQQVDAGQLEVSIEASHFDGGVDDATGAMVASEPTFTGLSLVQRGAAPSASAESGPAKSAALSARLSAAAIQATLGDDPSVSDLAEEIEDVAAEYVFLNPGQATGKAEEMGLDDIHERDVDGTTAYLPGADHDTLVDELGEESAEAAEPLSEGEWVTFTADGEEHIGRVAHSDEERSLVKRYDEDSGELTDEATAKATAHIHPTDPPESAEAAEGGPSEGDIVTWSSQGDRPAAGRVIETIDEGRYDTELSGDAVVNAPAALIRLHRPGDDGWGKTDVTVAHRTDSETLDVVESWPETAEAATLAAATEAAGGVTDDAVSPETGQAEGSAAAATDPDESNAPTDSPEDADPNMSNDNSDDPEEPAEVTELKATLSDKTDRIDTLESELADVKAERDEYEEQAEAVDEAEGAFAAALADHVPRDADALQDDLSLSQMRAWLSDIEDASVGDAAETDPEPSVQSGGGGGGGDQTANLSEAEQSRKNEIEARLAELENKDSDLAEYEADRLEDELDELEA